jgi:hypothetical protein
MPELSACHHRHPSGLAATLVILPAPTNGGGLNERGHGPQRGGGEAGSIPTGRERLESVTTCGGSGRWPVAARSSATLTAASPCSTPAPPNPCRHHRNWRCPAAPPVFITPVPTSGGEPDERRGPQRQRQHEQRRGWIVGTLQLQRAPRASTAAHCKRGRSRSPGGAGSRGG